MSLHERIRDNVNAINERIAHAAGESGRPAEAVTLIAVTKSVGVDAINVLRELGVRHFGENRVEAARDKIASVDDPDLTWHMVGKIQRRKARAALELFDRIDSLDRISLADSIQRHCISEDMHSTVLVEVNVSGETQKHGFAPEALAEALAHLKHCDRLRVDGLMAMAPFDADAGVLSRCFGTLRALCDEHGLPVASMGMSGDFEAAIRAGATEVRIGRALFE